MDPPRGPDPDLTIVGIQTALLSWEPDMWDVTKVAIFSTVTVVSIIGNCFIIAIAKKLFQQSPQLCQIVTSLAVADIVVGMTAPAHIVAIIIPAVLTNHHFCLSIHISVIFSITLSMLHIVLLAADRLVALQHAVRHVTVFKVWHVNLLLFLSWTYAMVTAGVLVLWLQHPSPESLCHSDVVFDRIYRLIHLGHYIVGAVFTLGLLTWVYYNSCSKRRARRIHRYGRRLRRLAEYSLRRNKLYTEALITMTTLFLGMCCPYFGLSIIHLLTDRTPLTTAIENIAVLVIITHTVVNTFVLPWKVRSYRYTCLYCVCPCMKNTKSKEEHDETVRMRSVSVKSSSGNMLNLHTEIGGTGIQVPRIVVTDFDGRNQVGGSSDKEELDDWESTAGETIWCSTASTKVIDDNETLSGNMFYLNPVNKDFLEVPSEGDVWQWFAIDTIGQLQE